ncbi:DUF4365 domain-containing protein [Streptomyces flaveus]|uniref:DUF4365 domain-containing protein n=1 Tax=Streptomyces flaveus TaxID=66370 RepID=A0A917QXA4_9ACTN|nr:DUF4365 domain-containing protein [Streptomyces flaveus]GGK73293.1 hypothetical protein GCM10010094_37960 [Streptomyces flaveus]
MSLNQDNRQGFYGEAFFQATVAAAGFTAQKQAEADLYLTDFDVGHPGPLGRLRYPKIGVQVKSSRNARLTQNDVRYKLKSKYYNELARPAHEWASPTFLVVVLVPKDPDDWMEVSADQLVLKDAAYWTCLHGQRQRQDLHPDTKVTLSVPRANLLTAEALRDMFDLADELRFQGQGVPVQ